MPIPMNINPATRSFGLRTTAMVPPRAPYRYPRLPREARLTVCCAGLYTALGTQLFEIVVEIHALHALLQLRLHFVERRHLRLADVVDLDHVPAELRLHRCGREPALRELHH